MYFLVKENATYITPWLSVWVNSYLDLQDPSSSILIDRTMICPLALAKATIVSLTLKETARTGYASSKSPLNSNKFSFFHKLKVYY